MWLLAPGAPPAQLLAALSALRVFCANVGGPRGDSKPNPRSKRSAAPAAGSSGQAAQLTYEPWLEPCRVRLGSLGTEQRLEAMVAAGLLPAAVRLVGEAVGGRGAAPEGVPAGSPDGGISASVSYKDREAVAASALGLLCGLASCEGMRDLLRCASTPGGPKEAHSMPGPCQCGLGCMCSHVRAGIRSRAPAEVPLGHHVGCQGCWARVCQGVAALGVIACGLQARACASRLQPCTCVP